MLNMNDLHQFINNNTGKTMEVPSAALTLLQLIISHRPNILFTSFHKSTHWGFYEAYNPQFNMKDGMNLASGWKQSVKYTLGELLACIDLSNTTMYPVEPVVVLVAKSMNRNRIQDVNARDLRAGTRAHAAISKLLRGVNTVATYMSRGYKMRGLGQDNAYDTKFTDRQTGKTVSVYDYFHDKYNIRLQYPELPVVLCSDDGKIRIPMEMLKIKAGQRFMGKLSDIQTSEIIKITAKPPEQRRRGIMDGRMKLHEQVAGLGQDVQSSAQYMKEWDIAISRDMKEVNARILDAPVVSGGSNSTMTPRDGGLDYKFAHQFKFFNGVELDVWAVAIFDDDRKIQDRDFESLMVEVSRECAKRGNSVARRDLRDVLVRQGNLSVLETLQEANMRALRAAKAPPAVRKAQLIFCVIPERSSTYDKIKHISETQTGVLTQCLLGKKQFTHRGLPQGVGTNLALKVNAKLGGTNTTVNPHNYLSSLAKDRVPTMILGCDLTRGGRDGVSIAAVVASMDPCFTKYRSATRAQAGHDDIIQHLCDMIIEQMQHFHGIHKFLPQRLLVYRDGVSEGQLQEVSMREINAIKLALRHLEISNCKVTFVIVTKRHSFRFFPVDQRDGDKKGNVKPGTVIDRDVTHPFEFQFLLYAHQGIQGTSKPTSYHALLDENGFTADALQEITYNLSYTYARATKSVSVTPAVYYAHLAAERARYHRPGGVAGGSEFGAAASSSSNPNPEDVARAISEFAQVTEDIKASMYFV
ncbi:Piwi domain-containing protein [Chytriomyces sp. MP71]|nr:Piwi domain-containing protein [Chytriomyces sp. MP71]